MLLPSSSFRSIIELLYVVVCLWYSCHRHKNTTNTCLVNAQEQQQSYYDNVSNRHILIDSIQINPGDIFGQQQGSKYSNSHYLKQLGYTGRSTSMEQSPLLCMNYYKADRVLSSSKEKGVFVNDYNSYVWTKAYCQSIERMMNETINAGLDIFVFTDMIVFPAALIELYPEIVHNSTTGTTTTGKVSIIYNNYTEYLLRIMLDEWMERFPQTNGIIIRTGETYTFDTPYHKGSSPIDHISNKNQQNHIWVQYINLLRNIICVQYKKKVIFRTRYSIIDKVSYINVTNQISIHNLLYFSIKHTSADFFRQMSYNELLNNGIHQQIIEIQIQREYEGKGSYPIYIFEHIVFGDSISNGSNMSLSQLFPNGCNNYDTSSSSIIQGLWTWSRGGGWWGPYIHDSEFWIDLNLHLFLSWWIDSNCTTTINDNTLIDLFESVCMKLILPPQQQQHHNSFISVDSSMDSTLESQQSIDMNLLRVACRELHGIMLIADRAMLYGRYCLEANRGPYSNCWIWTRDDRIGGLNELQSHMEYIRGNQTRIEQSLWYKKQSLVLWEQASNLYDVKVSSSFALYNTRIDHQIRNSFLYAQCYFGIIESGWRAIIYGTVLYNTPKSNLTLLRNAIIDYDARWNIYRAIGLTTPEFPSLYRGVYWNWPFEQESDGMDATIDQLRKLLIHDDQSNTS